MRSRESDAVAAEERRGGEDREETHFHAGHSTKALEGPGMHTRLQTKKAIFPFYRYTDKRACRLHVWKCFSGGKMTSPKDIGIVLHSEFYAASATATVTSQTSKQNKTQVVTAEEINRNTNVSSFHIFFFKHLVLCVRGYPHAS